MCYTNLSLVVVRSPPRPSARVAVAGHHCLPLSLYTKCIHCGKIHINTLGDEIGPFHSNSVDVVKQEVKQV